MSYNTKYPRSYVTIPPAPSAPTANVLTTDSTAVQGKAAAGSDVYVKNGSTVIGQGKADANGNYTITIVKQPANAHITITAKNLGGESPATAVTVTQAAVVVAPKAPAAPIVNFLTTNSTVVQGKTEGNATVYVKNGTTTIGQGKADGNGNYSVSIAKQAANAKVSVMVTGQGGNSPLTTVTVTQAVIAPAAPTVYALTTNSTFVQGKAEANSTVYVKNGSTTIAQGKADASGNYKMTIAKQKANTNLSIMVTGKGGNSPATTVTVYAPPAAPTANVVTNAATFVQGKTEGNASVYVKNGTKVIGQGKADASGNYKVTIAKQPVNAKLTIMAAGRGGNSPLRYVTVTKAVAAPKAPVVNVITTSSTFVQGKGEANATVYVKNGSKTIGQGKVDAKGNYKVTIAKQKAGTKLSVTLQNKAGYSPVVSTTVVAPPKAAVVNVITTSSTFVQGKGEGNATVYIKVGTKTIGQGKVDAKGNYKVAISKQKAGTRIGVLLQNQAGYSPTVYTNVFTPPKAPTAASVTTKTTIVQGKAEAGSTVYVKNGAKIIGQAKADSKGNYRVKIAKQRSKTKLGIVAQNKAGYSPYTYTTVK